jgi:hypothetical protein
LQIQDVLALVVGYGMAALYFRAFWPTSGLPASLGLPALGLYLWLGLAMSGPVILLRHGPWRDPPDEPAPGPSAASAPVASRTWAEWAWLLIGIYWIILGLFIIPARLHEFRFADVVLFGSVPFFVALALRLFGPRQPPRRAATSVWTHLAAVSLLAAWPIAWVCLIILCKRLP